MLLRCCNVRFCFVIFLMEMSSCICFSQCDLPFFFKNSPRFYFLFFFKPSKNQNRVRARVAPRDSLILACLPVGEGRDDEKGSDVWSWEKEGGERERRRAKTPLKDLR